MLMCTGKIEDLDIINVQWNGIIGLCEENGGCKNTCGARKNGW